MDNKHETPKKIDELIAEVERVNPKAGEIIKKRKNLLERSTIQTSYDLLQIAFRTYSESGDRSTHMQIPPSERFLRYYADQLIYFKADKFVPKYKKAGFKLQLLDTQLRRTDLSLKERTSLFVDFDKTYNSFLGAHSKALNILANPPKNTYQTGIQ